METAVRTNEDLDRAAYSIAQFCRVANISRSLAYQEIKRGRLRRIKVGRRSLIRREEVVRWLDRLEASSGGDQ